jgi:hypothetical protein
LWQNQSSGNPYPRGTSYLNNTEYPNRDFLFITYAVEDPGPYWAQLFPGPGARANLTVHSGAIAPESPLRLRASAGESILLSKGGIDEVFTLSSDAYISMEIGPQMGPADALYSTFEITRISGEFGAYDFGGIPVPASEFTGYDGDGTIFWDRNEFTYDAKVCVRAAGFVRISALIYGSGSILSASDVSLYGDATAVQIGNCEDVPSMSHYGLIVLAILLILAALIVWRKKRVVAAV